MTQLPESESFVLLRLSERRFALAAAISPNWSRPVAFSAFLIRRKKSKASSFAAAASSP